MGAASEVFIYLVRTALGVYIGAMLLRFLLQLVRADFYNPISQFLVKITNPLVLPLRRILPGFGGIDLSSLLLCILLEMLAIAILLGLYGAGYPNPVVLLVWGAVGLLGLLVNIYYIGILAMIILSWIMPGGGHPAVMLLYQLTEPVMAPFRKLLPSMGGMDFSPILVFIVLNVVKIIVGHLAAGVGLHPALVIGF